MNEERSNHDWVRIQKLGLEPQITSREAYHEILAENAVAVKGTVIQYPVLNPDDFYIQDLHQFLFSGVHPWAGKFRRPTDPQAIIAGFPGADAFRIPRELALLRAQFTELLSSFPMPGMIYLTLAFWHVRFERIHPFIDGNGRVGRLLLESQLNAVTEPKRRPSLIAPEKTAYIDALKVSNRTKDLVPLAKLIAERNGESVRIPELISPFRLAPFFEDEGLSLQEELLKSKE